MLNFMQKIFFSLVLISISYSALSADPKVRLEKITDEMAATVLKNKERIKKDSGYAKELIEKHLLPEVDMEYMTKRILGKTHWLAATEKQRATFTKEFVGLLLNSYAKGMASYNGQKISYENTAYSTSRKTANVRSTIQTDDTPILIDYRLKVQPDDNWLITDVIIEGVSMAKSYAKQYREQITNIGIEATLEKLRKDNLKAEQEAKRSDG